MSLEKFLQTQYNTLAEFVGELEKEQNILSQSKYKPEELATVTSRKLALVEKLTQLEERRAAIQIKLGYEQGIEGAAKVASDGGCSAIWGQILALAARAKTINDLNGQIIATRMEQDNKMLAALRSLTGGQLYGPNGKSKAAGYSRIASSA
ncbi:flagella synthesis protein FlgN [Pseudomonas aeruginosa]